MNKDGMKRVDLQLNTTCNQNCLFCASADSTNIFTSTKNSIKIVDELIFKRVNHISFSGGEPTLRRDLPILVDYIKSKKPGIFVEVLTNATRLSYFEYVKSLKNVDRFNVSLHGSTSKINDSVTRTPGSFKNTIKGIENISLLNYTFNLYFVITTTNQKQVSNFVDFIMDKFQKCQSFTFAYPFFSGNMIKNPEIQPRFSDIIPSLYSAKKKCDKHSREFTLASCGIMPLCVLGELKEIVLKNNIKYNENTMETKREGSTLEYNVTTEQYQKENFMRAKCCSDCKYIDLCPGVWRSYAKIYGLSELKALH